MDYGEAINRIGDYTYALLYKFSEQKLCNVRDLTDEDWEECLEARLFNTSAELHLFPQEKQAAYCSDVQDGSFSDIEYELSAKFRNMTGKNRVIVRRYFAQDEDGQTVIKRTRLQDLK